MTDQLIARVEEILSLPYRTAENVDAAMHPSVQLCNYRAASLSLTGNYIAMELPVTPTPQFRSSFYFNGEGQLSRQ